MLMRQAVAPLLGRELSCQPLARVHAQLRAIDGLLVDLLIGRAVLVLDDADIRARIEPIGLFLARAYWSRNPDRGSSIPLSFSRTSVTSLWIIMSSAALAKFSWQRYLSNNVCTNAKFYDG